MIYPSNPCTGKQGLFPGAGFKREFESLEPSLCCVFRNWRQFRAAASQHIAQGNFDGNTLDSFHFKPTFQLADTS